MNKKSLFIGLAFVLGAGFVILKALNIITSFPVFKIIACIILFSVAVDGIARKKMTEALIPLAIAASIVFKILGIMESVSGWPLIGASVLLSIGLDMIGKTNKGVEYKNVGSNKHTVITEDGEVVADDDDNKHKVYYGMEVNNGNVTFHGAGNEVSDDGNGKLEICTVFSNGVRYVDSAFEKIEIDNVFSASSVYLLEAGYIEGVSKIEIDNVFAKVKLYVPNDFALELKTDNVFGNVKVYGECKADKETYRIPVKIESVFGTVEIYYE